MFCSFLASHLVLAAVGCSGLTAVGSTATVLLVNRGGRLALKGPPVIVAACHWHITKRQYFHRPQYKMNFTNKELTIVLCRYGTAASATSGALGH